MTKLFAVGFPREMDEMQLGQLFAPYGDIELLTIVRDPFTQISKGFGFIHMQTERGAFDAIDDLNGKSFGDRQMEVRLADAQPEPSKAVTPVAPKYVPAGKTEKQPGRTDKQPERKKRPRLPH